MDDGLVVRIKQAHINFGRELRRVREELRLTQLQVANTYGTEGATPVWRAERGADGITLATMVRLADSMDCDVKITFVHRGQEQQKDAP